MGTLRHVANHYNPIPCEVCLAAHLWKSWWKKCTTHLSQVVTSCKKFSSLISRYCPKLGREQENARQHHSPLQISCSRTLPHQPPF